MVLAASLHLYIVSIIVKITKMMRVTAWSFLFLWCQSWCIHWWTRVILITEEKDLSKRKPSLHRVDEVERAAHLGTSLFMITIIIIFLKEQLTWEQVKTYCQTLSECLNIQVSILNLTPECFSKDSQMRRTLENQNMSWSRGINTWPFQLRF